MQTIVLEVEWAYIFLACELPKLLKFSQVDPPKSMSLKAIMANNVLGYDEASQSIIMPGLR